MTEEQQPKDEDKQPQMEGDDVVDTNAGDEATQGTIADQSDEPTKAE